jgi:thiol-disulfide isomerase/thioredoxin
MLRHGIFASAVAAATFLSAMALPARAEGLDLSPYKGKVVYLDFWASWCTPCHRSFPWMNDVQQLFAQQGLVVVAVDLDHDRAAADEFLAANRGRLQILYDPKGVYARQYTIKDMPTSVLIGRDGAVHAVHSGFYPEKENAYVADIAALLKQKTP